MRTALLLVLAAAGCTPRSGPEYADPVATNVVLDVGPGPADGHRSVQLSVFGAAGCGFPDKAPGIAGQGSAAVDAAGSVRLAVRPRGEARGLCGAQPRVYALAAEVISPLGPDSTSSMVLAFSHLLAYAPEPTMASAWPDVAPALLPTGYSLLRRDCAPDGARSLAAEPIDSTVVPMTVVTGRLASWSGTDADFAESAFVEACGWSLPPPSLGRRLSVDRATALGFTVDETALNYVTNVGDDVVIRRVDLGTALTVDLSRGRVQIDPTCAVLPPLDASGPVILGACPTGATLAERQVRLAGVKYWCATRFLNAPTNEPPCTQAPLGLIAMDARDDSVLTQLGTEEGIFSLKTAALVDATKSLFVWSRKCLGTFDRVCSHQLNRVSLADGDHTVVAVAHAELPFAVSPSGRLVALGAPEGIHIVELP